jgi:NAD(P)-dependent dehydrogenase (short-subunit alcohol dehydrogenase family)
MIRCIGQRPWAVRRRQLKRLTGKRALITGGARGIGAAIAQSFLAEGAVVTILDKDEAQGATMARATGATFLPFDVARESDWLALEQSHQAIDVMVNNAGITGFEDGPAPHDPEHASLADWHHVHATNLDGVFMGCRYAIRAMRRALAEGGSGGSIINLSSRSGLVGIPMAAAYASSKAAVRNHSKSVALYCAGQGLNIRCNSIHPAAILTPMWEAMLGDGPDRAERMAALVAETPMKRFGTVEEVASVAVLLASDEAAYMTGAELSLDGGLLAGSAASPG